MLIKYGMIFCIVSFFRANKTKSDRLQHAIQTIALTASYIGYNSTNYTNVKKNKHFLIQRRKV